METGWSLSIGGLCAWGEVFVKGSLCPGGSLSERAVSFFIMVVYEHFSVRFSDDW